MAIDNMSSHNIDLVLMEYSGFSTRKAETLKSEQMAHINIIHLKENGCTFY